MRNGAGLSLLHQAILKDDEKTALYLVKQGSNFDSKYANIMHYIFISKIHLKTL